MSKFQFNPMLAAALAAPRILDIALNLEADMAKWRQVALTAHPTANADYVRTVCEEIVRRGQIICRGSPADPHKVVPFLLEVTRRWLLGGLRIEAIGAKLPRDISGLGMLIVELNVNPNTGEPLTDKELRAASKMGKLKLQ